MRRLCTPLIKRENVNTLSASAWWGIKDIATCEGGGGGGIFRGVITAFTSLSVNFRRLALL